MAEFNDNDHADHLPDPDLARSFSFDRRTPPTDVLGALADWQIRKHHLQEIRKKVAENWPEVSSIRCTIDYGKPIFSVHIRDSSESFQQEQWKSLQEKHWPVGDLIDGVLKDVLGDRKCGVTFVPEPKIERLSHPGDVKIYPAQERENGIGDGRGR